MEVNEAFVVDHIRKYNRARRSMYRDKSLLEIGVHVGLIKKSKAIIPELTDEERQRVLYFCREFLKNAGIKAEIN